ncbi:MAG: pyridoxal-phosphate dependent enzyme [Acidobacteria bacterium]|nr:pyridoxal-phosphate dependent enzyme [Acidobacteriota bacterium]
MTRGITVDEIAAAADRLRGRIVRTPVRRSEWLSHQTGGDVHCKLEIVQPTGSYKIRGAFNAARQVAARTTDGRLVTASAGNHGRALAHAARELGLPLTVFIPSNAPRAKVDAIRAAGAELRPCADYDEAERDAKRWAAAGHGLFISPYSHADVIAGAGTIGLELLEDVPSLDAVVVPVGGGGLISGVGLAVRARSPSTRVIGVEVAASCPFTRSLAAGRLVTVDVAPSLADGLTGNLDPDTITFDLVRGVVDEIVVVDEPALRDALAGVVSNEHLIVEGAAAAAVAALTSGKIDVKGRRAVVILTGANIDTATLLRVLC